MSTDMNDAMRQIILIDGILKTLNLNHLNDFIKTTQAQLNSISIGYADSHYVNLLIENLNTQLQTARWVKAEIMRRKEEK